VTAPEPQEGGDGEEEEGVEGSWGVDVKEWGRGDATVGKVSVSVFWFVRSVSGARLINGISSVSSVRSGTSPEQSSLFRQRMVGFDYTNRLTREIGIAWERSVVKRRRKDHQLCKGRQG
jgi:hypothetical protein